MASSDFQREVMLYVTGKERAISMEEMHKLVELEMIRTTPISPNQNIIWLLTVLMNFMRRNNM